jgi:hypothetical protein
MPLVNIYASIDSIIFKTGAPKIIESTPNANEILFFKLDSFG